MPGELKSLKLLRQGEQAYKSGEVGRAIKLFKKAVQLHPKNPTAYNDLGVALESEKKHVPALKCYNESLKLAPKQVNVLNNKGFLLLKMQKNEVALKVFDQVLALEPKNRDARRGRRQILSPRAE